MCIACDMCGYFGDMSGLSTGIIPVELEETKALVQVCEDSTARAAAASAAELGGPGSVSSLSVILHIVKL